jgi:arabinogalactan oligomer/maltooligosaccharide transport system permease protein
MIKTRLAYYFIAPAVIVMALLVFYPLISGINLSFTNATQANVLQRSPIPRSGKCVKAPIAKVAPEIVGNSCVTAATYEYVGLTNYTTILTNSAYQFWPVFGQTVTWTVFNVIPHIGIGLGLALLLNRNIKGRTVYRVLLILPWAVPSYISAFVWRFIFNGDIGFLNNFFDMQIPWLSQPNWAMFSVIVANTWLAIPFNMVTILGGLQSIPGDLYEAANVDGANGWQKFTQITMPMLRPVMMTATLLGVIWTFNSFNIIFLVSEGGPFRSTEILATWAWRYGFSQRPEYGIAAAFSVVILLILIGFSLIYIRVLQRPGQEAL